MPAKKGAKHHNAKLTPASVREARRIFSQGKFLIINGERHPVTITALARRYGVSHQTMYSAIKGHTWGHVS